MHGVFIDGATGRRIDWQVHRTVTGLVVFLAIGVLAGMFGIGAGWANVPALNLLMGVPLKVAAGTSGLVLSLVDSAAAWVYVNQGAVLPMIAVPSVVGMMLGRQGRRAAAPRALRRGDPAPGHRGAAVCRHPRAAQGAGPVAVSQAMPQRRRPRPTSTRCSCATRGCSTGAPASAWRCWWSASRSTCSGVLPSQVPLQRLPELWNQPVARYLELTGAPTGWQWVTLLQHGDMLGFVGIAAAGRLLRLPACCRCCRCIVRRGDRAYLGLCLAQLAVLLVAAAGVFGGGH